VALVVVEGGLPVVPLDEVGAAAEWWELEQLLQVQVQVEQLQVEEEVVVQQLQEQEQQQLEPRLVWRHQVRAGS